ncbi:MAG: penicillin-binding protein 2 [Candidatus Sungbacteria bacterium]|nr:penicillin-binding protein 2 [Candidatus Sungbacteria bacterium]
MNWILLFFLTAGLALLGRLFQLQIIDHKDFVKSASRQHRQVVELLAERGSIFAGDKFGNSIPLAISRSSWAVIASPEDIASPAELAEILGKDLSLPQEEIFAKLGKKGDFYEVLEKNISRESAERIAARRLPGIYIEEGKARYYPYGAMAAHLLGFVSRIQEDEEGRYGLERYYESDLAGNKGMLEGVKDAAGFWVALGRRIIHPPKEGSKLFLTLDHNIQQKTEEVLAAYRKKWEADRGLAIVLEPRTGRILALASSPAFDPNAFSREKDFSVFLNPAAESMYELGSVMKPITMAGGIEDGVVRPDSTYYDFGEIKIKGYTIKNFDGKTYKTQTMTQVLEKSLNTGAVHVARLLGRDRQWAFLKKFGFGEKTGIDLPGEVSGNISNLSAEREIDFATASFGQGIAVTPLQMAMAAGAIANEGKLMRPYVVERIVDDSGNEIKKEPQEVRQVISKETAETLTKMLISVVRIGYENRAGVKGYFVAGKTGTAQIPRRDGRGYSDEVIHSFVGYAPAFNPKFLVFLQLNSPTGNRFAANTLTTAFHDLAEYILNYYEIPPDEK